MDELQDELQIEFNAWVSDIVIEDDIMQAANQGQLKAFCFNIYEDEDEFLVELVATDKYAADNDDWAATEFWDSGSVMFILTHAQIGQDWEDAHEQVCILAENFLDTNSSISTFLQTAEAIAVGVIDAELELIYSR
ncbi:hypothetical protein AwWohl_11690 [Gammaproteobacteria bacterium]|nr:hypothetical protein AwWohl_11690 [Gammaproteobacteria bacterium]